MFKISRHEIVNELFKASDRKILFAITYWASLPYTKIRKIFVDWKFNRRFDNGEFDELTDEELEKVYRDVFYESMGYDPQLRVLFDYIVTRVEEE